MKLFIPQRTIQAAESSFPSGVEQLSFCAPFHRKGESKNTKQERPESVAGRLFPQLETGHLLCYIQQPSLDAQVGSVKLQGWAI